MTQTQLYDPATQRVVKSFLDGTAGQTNGVINQYGVDYNTYTYNAAGQITAINDLQNANQPAGYSSGAQTTDLQCFTYDAEGRLTTAWSDNGGTTPAATPILNDANGAGPAPGGIGSCTNSAPTNAAAGKNQSTGGPAPYWQTFAVDAAGNRTTMTDHDVTSGTTAGDSTRNYSYKNSTGGQPHTLTQVSTTTAGAATPTSYTYDAAGNTKTRPGTTAQGEQLTWDPEGRLQHVDDNGATTDYVYDAAGNQLLRRDSINHTTSLYLGTLELHLDTRANTVTGDRYYASPGAPTMVADQTGKITYEAGNSQGTALTTIDATTGKVAARRYVTPYSAPRGPTAAQWPDDHTFLGKTTDSSTGLVDVGARKYDPITGRFLSADPVFQVDDPRTIGGYAYAGNDPVSSSDPSGLYPVPPSDWTPPDPHENPNPKASSPPADTSGDSVTGPDGPPPPDIIKQWQMQYDYHGSDKYTYADALQYIAENPTLGVLAYCQVVENDGENCADFGPGPGWKDIAKQLSGWNDAVDCRHADVGACAWTAAGFLGWFGKAAKLAKDTDRLAGAAADIDMGYGVYYAEGRYWPLVREYRNVALGHETAAMALAVRIGGEHMMEESHWREILGHVVNNPEVTFSVSLDGLGDLSKSSLKDIVQRQIDSGTNVGWELALLRDNGRLAATTFYDASGEVANTFG
ncbi:RHS repeat-associated core domain-containing protein [Catenulispora sp. NF23]|uniref:RHS repeat-associated core domain-containing protein n=1 Tax=Catenulispora pinistramenti TaxID=2705254 RepID=UPI001BA47CDC|nr:RHS repeat-associated core domain-containing protein [Catenulispora pinistramenti]MBS2531639.1 RHS repeat-associated core domain-containing protein [Catenulispora pinistramenti]